MKEEEELGRNEGKRFQIKNESSMNVPTGNSEVVEVFALLR